MAERRRARSPLFTALALSLLAIPGFAVGLLAGVAWEDPGLLAAHVFGGTEEVAWSQAAETEVTPVRAPTPPPAAPLPAVAAPPRPDVTRMRPEVLSPGGSPTPASPVPTAGFAVQVGAFSERASADRLAASLRRKGFPTFVVSGDGRWRVRVGPLASRGEAERSAGRLKTQEKLPTWIIDQGAA